MLGNRRKVLSAPFAAGLAQPLGHQRVVLLAVAFQHGFIGHIAQQGVLEGVFFRAIEGGIRAVVNQFFGAQRSQRFFQPRLPGAGFQAERLERALPKHAPHDGSALEGSALEPPQPAQACLENARQRGRDG